jgi:hypothetical protein
VQDARLHRRWGHPGAERHTSVLVMRMIGIV